MTPPMWAIKAADNLHGLDSVVRGPDVLRENAEIIASHAPDAEALAQQLQDALMCIVNSGEYVNVVRRGSLVLSSYRSAHPVQSSTLSILGDKVE